MVSGDVRVGVFIISIKITFSSRLYPVSNHNPATLKKNAGTVMCNYLVQVCTNLIYHLISLLHLCCTFLPLSASDRAGVLVESLEALGRKTWSPATENILGVYTQRFVAIRVFRRVSCHCWCVEWHDEPPDASPGPPGSGRLVRP